MQLYNATVRIKTPDSASWIHELPKSELTAPEIMVLRAIHGDESVIGISQTKMDKREKAGEVERLRATYGPAVVHRVFGPQPVQMMPIKLDQAVAEEVKE